MNKVKIEGIIKFEPRTYKNNFGIVVIEFEENNKVGSIPVKIFNEAVYKLAIGDKIGVLGQVRQAKQTGGKFKDAWLTEVVCNDLKIYEKSGNPSPLQQESKKSSLEAKLSEPTITEQDCPF